MAPSIAVPALFTRALEELRSVAPRPEILVEEMPPPQRLAPFSYALSGQVMRREEEVATGRLILLHDPNGHDAWHGTMRFVTYITAELEPELATDPLLPAVGWSWLTDALETHEAEYRAVGGTVTQTLSTRFGQLIGGLPSADIEIRASWTPRGSHFAAHMRAWCAAMASTAGLPPPGVVALQKRRVGS